MDRGLTPSKSYTRALLDIHSYTWRMSFWNLRIGAQAPLAREALIEQKTVFNDLSTCEMTEFSDKLGRPLSRPLMYCKDTAEFISRLAELRGLDEEALAEN